ncbi:aspartate dehydrogenase [Paenibacillus sp. IB182496]|uniref:L-aspartate dehydrogenase n=1 Tax=Paenibacillus sabuli TaxID=2772509 RepID=A0A927BSH0_9BACL|nr:aspartate dehydrogenase [Paenibacillus sabuli]MBD2844940.1 aspartate dehydrogenase [Paenibacillus sabuli]
MDTKIGQEALRVGVIGYGTVGADVVRALRREEAGRAALTAVLVRDISKYKSTEEAELPLTDSMAEFLACQPDVVVECAGHAALRTCGAEVLASGADLVVVSVGALAEDELLEHFTRAALAAGSRLVVPSAAIGGLDRIAAGSVGQMERVTLTTRKPPRAWYGTRVEQEVDLATLAESYCAFEGPAREAARLFPESVNVSAALSLAGIGMDRTQVRVFADPTIEHNTHEIEAHGHFGSIRLHIANTPSKENPKTGYIVAMSVIKTLRGMTAPLLIGL